MSEAIMERTQVTAKISLTSNTHAETLFTLSALALLDVAFDTALKHCLLENTGAPTTPRPRRHDLLSTTKQTHTCYIIAENISNTRQLCELTVHRPLCCSYRKREWVEKCVTTLGCHILSMVDGVFLPPIYAKQNVGTCHTSAFNF